MLHLVPCIAALIGLVDEALLTKAESSEYRATTSSAEVAALIEKLDARSAMVHRVEIGRSSEDRAIPMLILGGAEVATPAGARAAGRLVVLLYGNIHAGEVCGKEATLRLARELSDEAAHPLLSSITLLIVPNLNPDGNDRISPDNRPGQVGPEEGMGTRHNAQDLDLNRDFMKLQSPEIRALVQVLNDWDPDVIVDTHTTNGSRHRYVLTWEAPTHPATHPDVMKCVREHMLPEVAAELRSRTEYETFFYGNFDDDQTAWYSYSAEPRFGGPYQGLRGHLAVLSEAYAYAPYRDRVLATLEFMRSILQWCGQRPAELLAIRAKARADTVQAGAAPQYHDTVAIRTTVSALPEPVTVQGYGRGNSQEAIDHRVIHFGRFEGTVHVPRPFAYLIEPGCDDAVATLRRHGLRVQPVTGRARVQRLTVSESRTVAKFQGHDLRAAQVSSSDETVELRDGTVLVRVDHPLGSLAVQLLEPAAEDGLTAWNFFDAYLNPGGAFPVMRVMVPANLDEAVFDR